MDKKILNLNINIFEKVDKPRGISGVTEWIRFLCNSYALFYVVRPF